MMMMRSRSSLPALAAPTSTRMPSQSSATRQFPRAHRCLTAPTAPRPTHPSLATAHQTPRAATAHASDMASPAKVSVSSSTATERAAPTVATAQSARATAPVILRASPRFKEAAVEMALLSLERSMVPRSQCSGQADEAVERKGDIPSRTFIRLSKWLPRRPSAGTHSLPTTCFAVVCC
jgi:hypothetical protein